MSPFRLFGRTARVDRTPDAGPDPWLDDPPAAPPVTAGTAPGWTGTGGPGPARPVAGPDPGPATAAARPVPWTPRRPPVEPQADPEPVTDPFGFPPVPPTTVPPAPDDVAAAWAAWAPAGPGPVLAAGPPAERPRPAVEPAPVPAVEPVPRPAAEPVAVEPVAVEPAAVPAVEPAPTAGGVPEPAPEIDVAEIDVADAASLAGSFAADLLSWDEDDPGRRGHALTEHLSEAAAAGLLGWTGTGRQRADLVLPGRVRPGADGRVLVDVRVRVVPYRRVDARGAGVPEPAPEQALGTPAAAPAVSARGWRGLAARWMRVQVSVARDGDRLVVDAGPASGADPAPPSPRDLATRRRPS
ncbi:hypothetical protein ACLFMI_22060 [Pseudonocardia nantongensis]